MLYPTDNQKLNLGLLSARFILVIVCLHGSHLGNGVSKVLYWESSVLGTVFGTIQNFETRKDTRVNQSICPRGKVWRGIS